MIADIPLVSIIIPCHNAARYVADAIRSALDQTYPHKEVIVIDDGSTDRSLEVIRRFQDSIHYSSGPNRGACAARNTGIEMARGQFVQFLDADDLLDSRKLEIQVPLLKANPRALVYCDQRVIGLDVDASQSTQWNRNERCDDPIEFMLRGDLSILSPVHWKGMVLEVGGFREDLPGAQDRDFHLRLAMAGISFLRIPECLLTIRRRAGSISTSNPGRIYRCQGEVARSVFDQLNRESKLTESRRKGCAAMSLKAARGLIRCGAPSDAKILIEQARAMHYSAGVDLVYSRSARLLLNAVGPMWTERMISLRSRVRR